MQVVNDIPIEPFKHMVEIVSKFSEYLTLVIEDGIITCKTVDVANVCFVHAKIKVPTKICDTFVFDSQEVFNALKNFDQPVTLIIDDAGRTKLLNDKLQITLSLLAYHHTNMNMPKLSFDHILTVDRKDFLKGVNSAKIYSGDCSLIIKDDIFTIETNMSRYTCDVSCSGVPSSVLLKVDYLLMILDGLKPYENIVMGIRTKTPLLIGGQHPDVQQTEFMLAPIIEDPL